MINDLKQFLLCPGGATLSAEVVQDKKWGTLHLLKKLIIGNITAWAEGRAQMVKEVRNTNKKDGIPLLKTLIGNSGSEMSLATATWSHEYQPPLPVLGKVLGCLTGTKKFLLIRWVTTSTLGYQIIKSKTG